ncbi:hypothetical protein BVER_03260 [Candidatus Burkholderia verschuerenii]|uniref:PIN domain-containing protein n=1 Tax=Candidatus Burkholderia verschuerenii TaxID=242163 RepID=A0A0L0MB38_9BURK|nr:hypothetical protein [Candidatus Burkholderia verschuerenii]KND59485.1 hypothetical protein BVER_03260 [Candidatus Burkholderia verschuerenii]
MNSVLLDTSFLICLSDSNRSHHALAKTYFQRFIAEEITMYLSTIVISEFEVKQRISSLGLSNFIVLPFNYEDALLTARLFNEMHGNRQESDARVAIKDDAKILGQCVFAGITHFATDDDKCVRRMKAVRAGGLATDLPHAIDLHEPFWEGWFTENNQGNLPFDSNA